MKYTNFADSSSSLAPVAAEWKMIDIISSYNGISDADALSPVGLTNASIFTHQPLKTPFTQNNDKEAIMADKVIKEKYNSGTKYVVMYVGDYDCGAWTSGVMPSKFLLNWGSTDRYPLAWQVDSDLATRVPHAFNWMYAHQNRNDYFVGGDNGTGYLNPMQSPDLTKWKNHNIDLNEQFERNWEEIAIERFKFNVKEENAEYLKKCNKEGFINFYEKYFMNEAKILDVQYVCEKHWEDNEKKLKENKNYFGGNNNKRIIIDKIEDFHDCNWLYPCCDNNYYRKINS